MCVRMCANGERKLNIRCLSIPKDKIKLHQNKLATVESSK